MSQLIPDETRYHLLKLLQADPHLSQRELAETLGISLGKANYCLKALINKGWVKARNFRNSHNKKAYAYFLTPAGIEEKALVTIRFLKYKMGEYEALSEEIEQLRHEAEVMQGEQRPSAGVDTTKPLVLEGKSTK